MSILDSGTNMNFCRTNYKKLVAIPADVNGSGSIHTLWHLLGKTERLSRLKQMWSDPAEKLAQKHMLYLLKTCCHGPLWRATFQPGHRCCLCFSAGADLVCLPCKIACHAEVNIVQMLLDSSSTIVLLFMMAAGSCKSAFTFKQEYSFL